MSVCICTTLFWAVIILFVTYRSELYVSRPDKIEHLRKFQRNIGRRWPRFPSRLPSFSAVFPLGWVSTEPFIRVKSLFLRQSCLCMMIQCVARSSLSKLINIRTIVTKVSSMLTTAQYIKNLMYARSFEHSKCAMTWSPTCAIWSNWNGRNISGDLRGSGRGVWHL